MHVGPSENSREYVCLQAESDFSEALPFGDKSTEIVYCFFTYSKRSSISSVFNAHSFVLNSSEVCVNVFASKFTSHSALNKFIKRSKVPIVVKTFSQQLEVNDSLIANGFSFLTCQAEKSGELYSYFVAETNRPSSLISFQSHANTNCSIIKRVDVKLLCNEIEIMKSFRSRFVSLEKSTNFNHTWKMIALRSIDGKSETLKCPNEENSRARIPLPAFRWTDFSRKFPVLLQLVKSLWVEDDILRVRMSLLTANGKILRHADKANKSNDLIPNPRFHLVLSTNDQCFFNSINSMGKIETYRMKEGEVWIVNNCFPHWVENNGPFDRYHFLTQKFEFVLFLFLI